MKAFIKRYKIPLLLSLVIALAVVILGGVSYWLSAVLAFVGAFIGMLLLDAEYVVHAYLIDSQDEKSQKIQEYIRTKNFNAFFYYLNEYEYSFGDMSIRSVLFQVLLAVFTLYVLVGNTSYFAQALALSLYIRILYEQLIELQKTKSLKRWFWIYKGDLSQRGYYFYFGFMVLVLMFMLVYL